MLPCLLFQKEFEEKAPKEQASVQGGVIYSKTAPALTVAASESADGSQKKPGKGKFRIGKKKKSASTGAVASQEQSLKKDKTKGKKASKSKKKSGSKDSDGAPHQETKGAISPVVLEDYDGGEEPKRVGGVRAAAMSCEDMPQPALDRNEGEARVSLD